MFAWLCITALTGEFDAVSGHRRARASVRVERDVRGAREEWHLRPPERRREIVYRDDVGRKITLRIADYP